MRHRTIVGKIAYLTDGIGEEGREYFTMTVQPDGSRMLRAMVEMDNDRLIRDVTYSLGPDWTPEECFIRLTQHEKFVGSALFRFFDDHILCEANTVTEGRFTQRLPIDAPLPSFGAHPVCCDTWHAKAGDLRRGNAREYFLKDIGISSPLPNGGSGPIACLVDVNVKYIGEETLTTPAGTFATKHFENWSHRDGPPKPPVVVWFTSDDAIPVRLRWELLSQTYELVELKIIEGDFASPSAKADSLTRMAQYGEAHKGSTSVLEGFFMTTDKYPRYAEDLFDMRQAVKNFLIAGNTPANPIIGADTLVRTQGSCFAVNIALALLARGIKATYLEIAEWVNSPLANKVLFDHLLDPGLPFAEPEHEMLMTQEHLASMRVALPHEDVFIFTLGVAPCMFQRGRANPAFNTSVKNAEDYELRHTTVAENEDALRRIIHGVRSFNPNMQVVFTVSPVPLNRSLGLGPAVEVDCISKSTLRVAVANVMRDNIKGVYYWPSFEIVRWLAPHAAPAYGLDDGLLRHVNTGLIDLITDLFVEYYGGAVPPKTP